MEHLLPDTGLISSLPLTLMARSRNLHHWDELLDFVQALPYGRTVNRADFAAVFRESKGTCSSKHALLAKLAYENDLEEVVLNIALFRMNGRNTPAVGPILATAGLDYLPEAHCFLRVDGRPIDVTSRDADIHALLPDVIEEMVVDPEFIVHEKEAYHRERIRQWAEDEGLEMSPDELWAIREQCISKLSGA